MSSYIAEAIRNGDLTEEQLGKIEEALKEKRGYTEPTKAYAKGPYGKQFIEAVLKLLKKAGIKLSDEDQSKLEAMAGKTGELSISRTGDIFSVLPQEEGGTLTKLKVNLATGELYRPMREEEVDKAVDEFMTHGIQHQREFAETQRRKRSNRERSF